ncbi:MAG: hypothetical protein Q7K40_03225 [bacterium]|nr:hypothetical protein [bacterium]
MITFAEHKKTLEAKGIYLPDKEVEKLLATQYKFANAFFDFWVMKTKPDVVIEKSIVVHKNVTVHTKNGNCVSVESYTFAYAYSY